MVEVGKDNKTAIGYAFTTAVSTITPLHIGNGNTLSPFGDYFIKNGSLHFINSENLSVEIDKWGRTEDYIKKALEAVDKSKHDFFEKYFQDSPEANITELLSLKYYPAYVTGNPVGLSEFVKSNGRAYIPGSSLKGALRSAILFDWLYTDGGNRAFETWVAEFIRHLEENKPKNQKIRDIENSYVSLIEEAFFGRLKSKEERLAMSCLKISDSNILDDGYLAAYEVFRFHLISGETKIPALKECVDRGTSLQIHVGLDFDKISLADKKQIFPSQLRKFNDPQILCDVINQYSKKVLEYELEVMSYPEVNRSITGDYANWLSMMLQLLNSPENRTAYLRLGHGKMQFYQTIGMKMFDFTGRDETDNDWLDYLRYCERFPSEDKDIPDVYPVTRALTSYGQIPLGWIKLQF